MTRLTGSQRRLLGSYRGGPRIWDAVSVLGTVFQLEALGLVEPSGAGGAYALTEAGRRALDARYTLTAFYDSGDCEVFRVSGDAVDEAVAGLEDQPDLILVSIREEE